MGRQPPGGLAGAVWVRRFFVNFKLPVICADFPGTKRTLVNLFALRKAGLVRAFSTRALQPSLNRGISIHNRDDDCFRFR